MAIPEPSIPSALVTVSTTTVVTAAPALVTAISLHPGSGASSCIVYDAAAGTGNVLGTLLAAANTASVSLIFNSPVYAAKGITVTVAGTAAQAQVHYQKSN